MSLPYVLVANASGVSSWRELIDKPVILDPKVVDLGRYLFFDPILSQKKNMSCSQCHDPKLGLSDGKKRSVGAGGVVLSRSAPSLWNLAFANSFFWDGRIPTLEKQVVEPIFNSDEMGNTREELLRDLNANQNYRQLFAVAFGTSPKKPVLLDQVVAALAAFIRSLTSFDSPYDRYINGDANALSRLELTGLNVFRSFATRCSECHVPPLFTNQQIVVTGVPEEDGIDLGAGVQRGEEYARAFKTPSLRNVARTAPYMHAGNFADLRGVIDFYNDGGGRPEGVSRMHWHVRKLSLADDEKVALTAFLQALTDESHLPLIPESVPSGLTPIQSQ